MSKIEEKLASMGVVLPAPTPPIATYVPVVKTGNLLFVSGQLCLGSDGKIAEKHKGKVGQNVSFEEAQAAARLCAINLLVQVKSITGDLDAVTRCVRLGGFVNADPAFATLASVVNGASDFIVEVFGKEIGLHARAAVGVAELPLDAVVEVDGIFEVKG